MADPPWDIHMELPYGTMSDDEMRQLGIPTLQDDGLIFLWVTGRSAEGHEHGIMFLKVAVRKATFVWRPKMSIRSFWEDLYC